MGHADFRVGRAGDARGRIFASLPPAHPDEPRVKLGMVKLTPVQQQMFIETHPDAFVAAAGAWGRAGCTYIRLARAAPAQVKRALSMAWTNAAPKKLLEAVRTTPSSKPSAAGRGPAKRARSR